ncbi:putative RNA polymerase-associated transcriptional specificity factor [Diachasmimorpha longicaudata entomopoxvirus]|uniref:RNA polymerase-associated transcription-specificity factor RAP94 n=1 Tax=Diachasmimorpha longicaudata entomopoxvirus TaxID=109981 RepID=A0A7R5WG86_9POXV|nr:putative RNA polymerase-associated transcriptional specificity factor [Diachasmimorpha longicaudata entomopoxvirus]AKS26430.1 putative RNA polymerase-associated transcriptional specificity factor [Diachasmimorpha longicaudata entomopoxvirus]
MDLLELTKTIDFIKHELQLSKDEKKIQIEIENRLKLYILRGLLSFDGIIFLISLVSKYRDYDSKMLTNLFLTHNTTFDLQVMASQSKTLTSTNVLDLNQNITNFLNIFRKHGSLKALPRNLVLLWNDEQANDVRMLSNEEISGSLDKGIILKRVNFQLLSQMRENNRKSLYFKNFENLFAVPYSKRGWKSKYEINVDIEGFFFSFLLSGVYLGDIKLSIQNNKLDKSKVFTISTSGNKNQIFEQIIDFFQEDLIRIFKKNKPEAIKNLLSISYLFEGYYENLYKSILEVEACPERQKYKKYITYTPKEDILLFKQDAACEHVRAYDNILNDKLNYLQRVEEFIEDFLDYTDGRAQCKKCFASLPNFSLYADVFIDTKKYVMHGVKDIFSYSPFNNFLDGRFFFENFLFHFDLWFGIDSRVYSNEIATQSILNFIHLHENRPELVKKYKKMVEDGEIFFLQSTNTFFQTHFNIKDKFKNERLFFRTVLVVIIISCFLRVSDYHIMLIKRKISKKTKVFEDMVVSILKIVLKKLNITYFNNSKDLLQKYYRIVKIYSDEFLEETHNLFLTRKEAYETYIQDIEKEEDFDIQKIENYMDIEDVSEMPGIFEGKDLRPFTSKKSPNWSGVHKEIPLFPKTSIEIELSEEDLKTVLYDELLKDIPEKAVDMYDFDKILESPLILFSVATPNQDNITFEELSVILSKYIFVLRALVDENIVLIYKFNNKTNFSKRQVLLLKVVIFFTLEKYKKISFKNGRTTLLHVK